MTLMKHLIEFSIFVVSFLTFYLFEDNIAAVILASVSAFLSSKLSFMLVIWDFYSRNRYNDEREWPTLS